MTKTKFTSPTGGVEYIDTPSLRTRYGGKSEMWVSAASRQRSRISQTHQDRQPQFLAAARSARIRGEETCSRLKAKTPGGNRGLR